MSDASQQNNKPMPTIEYSLKSISWHLKTIVEEIRLLREDMKNKPQDNF